MTHEIATVAVFGIVGVVAIIGMCLQVLLKLRRPREDAGVSASLQSLEQRFARVEVAIDDLTTELHRVSESNGFLTRLLSERSREAGTVDHH
jgi:hypothetical protein